MGTAGICFVNVDLEVEAREPLDLLVREFGEDVFVLYNGEARGRYLAAFETALGSGDAETTIACLCGLVESLPEEARALWDRCILRTFDIGYEGGDTPSSFRSIIHPLTLRRVADLGATLVVTIYPPAPDPKSPER